MFIFSFLTGKLLYMEQPFRYLYGRIYKVQLSKTGAWKLVLIRTRQRTSDGGNGNHSVSLPIILIKIKVDQMLPFSYIRLLLVSIL